jgi:hypothetical protein
MTARAKIIITGLAGTVAILAVALAVVLATDDDDAGNHMGQTNGYMGMMQAMGDMSSDRMLTAMREVLGPDGYQRMLDHIADHRKGGQMPGNTGMDGMMHQMMDGMMQQMPADQKNIMPMAPH